MSRLLLLAMLLSLCAGCASDQDDDTELDRMWRQGYGFNNPNPDRAKQGLPPVDFDGEVHR